MALSCFPGDRGDRSASVCSESWREPVLCRMFHPVSLFAAVPHFFHNRASGSDDSVRKSIFSVFFFSQKTTKSNRFGEATSPFYWSSRRLERASAPAYCTRTAFSCCINIKPNRPRRAGATKCPPWWSIRLIVKGLVRSFFVLCWLDRSNPLFQIASQERDVISGVMCVCWFFCITGQWRLLCRDFARRLTGKS